MHMSHTIISIYDKHVYILINEDGEKFDIIVVYDPTYNKKKSTP